MYLVSKQLNFAVEALIEEVVEHEILFEEIRKILKLQITQWRHLVAARVFRLNK